MDPNYLTNQIEQRVADMTDAEFDQLVARTRAPKVDQRQAADRVGAMMRGEPAPKPKPTGETPWIPESPWRPDAPDETEPDPKTQAADKLRKALGL